MKGRPIHLLVHGIFLRIAELHLFHVWKFLVTKLDFCLEGVDLLVWQTKFGKQATEIWLCPGCHQNSVNTHDNRCDGMRLVEHVYKNGISHFCFGTMHAANNRFSFKPKKPNEGAESKPKASEGPIKPIKQIKTNL